MTDFHFSVDDPYARKHNEFFRDARRLQWSAGILALILVVAAVLAVRLDSFSTGAVLVAGALVILAVICLVIIPALPKAMGSPQQYYDTYALVPAVVAKVNPRDLVLMALVDAAVEGSGASAPALAVRTVTSVPGVAREVGARVPSVAVTGGRTMSDRTHWQEISPMPVCWGTPDRDVWRAAEEAVPASAWRRLGELVGRVDEVVATKHNLLPLDRAR